MYVTYGQLAFMSFTMCIGMCEANLIGCPIGMLAYNMLAWV